MNPECTSRTLNHAPTWSGFNFRLSFFKRPAFRFFHPVKTYSN